MGTLYTNTSKVSGVVGLVVTTVLLSYVQANSTKIVDGAISAAKKGIDAVSKKIHHGAKQQYAICGIDIDGKMYDTGKRIWK